jgi:surface antigen
MTKKFKLLLILIVISIASFFVYKKLAPDHSVGDVIDSLNNVNVYYNGSISHVSERNTVDGYNIGLKYQCVEFVKRYYFEYYKHRMPNSYGHAKDFYNPSISDGNLNPDRGLIQCTNPSSMKPQIGDLIVMGATTSNEYGHVAIVSYVSDDTIEIIQQNAGVYGNSRANFELVQSQGKWKIISDRILGWLRK